MALEEDLPEKPDDKTIPKYKQIDKVRNTHTPCNSILSTNHHQSLTLMISKRAGSYVIDWGVELEQQYQAWRKDNGPTTTLAKRPAASSSHNDGGAAPKKAKTQATATGSSDGMGDEEMRDHYNKNTVGKVCMYNYLFYIGKYVQGSMLTSLVDVIAYGRGVKGVDGSEGAGYGWEEGGAGGEGGGVLRE